MTKIANFSSMVSNRTQKVIDDLESRFNGKESSISTSFFDSLFDTETAEQVYFKVIIISLWVFAFILVLTTIFILVTGCRQRTSLKMILFHVFLCELFYLIYILLSMINVAMDFQLNNNLCRLANYGMYVTIPMLHIALLMLCIERLSVHLDSSSWIFKICARAFLSQLILCLIWLLFLAIIITIFFVREQLVPNLLSSQLPLASPSLISQLTDTLIGQSTRCSIDGRLSSVVKIVLSILFILLVALSIEPLMSSMGTNLLKCIRRWRKRTKSKAKGVEQQRQRRASLVCFVILLVNVCFSFPFYFISIFTKIFVNIEATRDVFTKTIKIAFIFRILSIIFQCLVVHIISFETWEAISARLPCRSEQSTTAPTKRSKQVKDVKRHPSTSDITNAAPSSRSSARGNSDQSDIQSDNEDHVRRPLQSSRQVPRSFPANSDRPRRIQ